MIKPTMLRMKNFLSIGNAMVEIDLAKNNLTVIIGTNGTGKSTIMDGIAFAWFGRAFREIKKAQIVNTVNQKGLLVELEFEAFGNDYKVVRGIKPDIFEIWKNGALVPKTADVRSYQAYLENEVLRMNFKTFSQVVVIGSATFTPFMELEAADRRKVVEDLLDLHVFSRMSVLAKARFDEIKEQISGSRSRVDTLSATIQAFEKMLATQRNSTDEEIQSVRNQIDVIENEIKDIEVTIRTRNESLDNLLKELQGIPASLDEATDKRRGLESTISSSQTLINSSKKLLDFVTNNDNCPTCKQGIIHSHKEKITEITSSEITINQATVAKAEKRLDMVRDIVSKIQKLNNDIAVIRNQISMSESSLNNKKHSIKLLLERIESIENRVVESVPLEKLSDAKADIRAENNNYDNLMKRQAVIKAGQGLLKDDGIKTVVISKYIPKLNELINQNLERMEFFCSFHLDEKFDETIKARHRDTLSYKSFSEGEKMRINLAVLMAIREIARIRNSISCSLLIMDEIFDGSMDGSGIAEFMNVLREMSGNQNVFVVSHNPATIDGFERVIKVEKQGNFSVYSEME